MNFGAIRELANSGDEEGAVKKAIEYAKSAPGDAAVQYETACFFDALGREAEAVPYYLAALAGSLSTIDRRGAFLGLGSTYRSLGRYFESDEIFARGRREFPEAHELVAFHAMTKYNLHQPKQAVAELLSTLVDTSHDPYIQKYKRAVRFYAEDLDKTW